jgi:hypothetical protein
MNYTKGQKGSNPPAMGETLRDLKNEWFGYAHLPEIPNEK